MVLLRLLAFKPGSPVRQSAEKKTLSEPVRAPLPLPAPVPVAVKPVEPPAPPPVAAPAPVVPAVQELPVRVQAEPSERLQARPVPVAAPPVHTADGDYWHATVQQLIAADAVGGLVRELALQSQLLAVDGANWRLRIERESLSQPMSRERLRVALESITPNATLDIEIGSVADSPAKRNAAAANEKQRIAEEIILGDPLVQSLMRDFGAKIVPGTLKPV